MMAYIYQHYRYHCKQIPLQIVTHKITSAAVFSVIVDELHPQGSDRDRILMYCGVGLVISIFCGFYWYNTDQHFIVGTVTQRQFDMHSYLVLSK